ncbi:hypothetical protein ONZ45_g13435 [Pleurotus djamor]|nr:hypothetical protein ONZ45_g13435 [Pleurotus djamor]
MASEWSQWQRITTFIPPGKALYRSSGPNIVDPKNPSNMTLTPTALDYLVSQRIDGRKKIDYKWINTGLTQFTVPTPADIDTFCDFFSKHKSVLIYDSNLKWMSGFAIIIIQLKSSSGRYPPQAQWKNFNIEKPEHIEALKAFQKKLIGSGPDPTKPTPTKPSPTKPTPTKPGPTKPTPSKPNGGKGGKGNPDWFPKPV